MKNVTSAILLERVTHELSGDMTHDPKKNQNLPKIDDLTQFRNILKGILMNGNTEPQSIVDPPAFTIVFLGSKLNK